MSWSFQNEGSCTEESFRECEPKLPMKMREGERRQMETQMSKQSSFSFVFMRVSLFVMFYVFFLGRKEKQRRKMNSKHTIMA